MTQEELADKAGVSVRTVRDLESGRVRYPRAATVRLLVAALDVVEPPRQLPPPVATFTGRCAEITEIGGLLASTSVAIAGMGGVGKTALAVQIGHAVADRFPDGQLHVAVRDHAPLALLRRLLRAFGVPAAEIPADLDGAAASWRSVLAGRRVLLVLDDAARAEQVEPLLPGSPGCAAIITARSVMSALPQVRHVSLRLPSEEESVESLAAAVGRERVDREPDPAAALVRRCGRLPLAVHLASARLVARPSWPIGHLAERLAAPQRRLDELDRDDVGVRTCFAASVDRLLASSPDDARAFGLLGRLDSPSVTAGWAAQALELPRADAERTLERLADLHLIEPVSATRYRMHNLLRLYARERCGDLVPGRLTRSRPLRAV
jgi:hypothetical protein